MKQQSGFTLIELIMVIVILGILAATALPKFFDLSSDAKQAALTGLAGSISSGGNINFAVRSLRPASGVATSVSGVGSTCTIGLYTSMVDATTSLAGFVATGSAPTCAIGYLPAVTGVTSAVVSIPLIN